MGEAGDVPICSPHAAVTGEGADAVGIVGAVDADSGLAEADPADSDGIVGTAREHVKLASADAAIQHAFVPAKCGHGRYSEDAPLAWRSRMGAGTRRNGDAGDECVFFV